MSATKLVGNLMVQSGAILQGSPYSSGEKGLLVTGTFTNNGVIQGQSRIVGK
jgi:hypothetical protein